MKFINAVRHAITNYANFKGRSNRRDFWFWILFAALVLGIGSYIDGAFVAPWLGYLPNEESATQPLTTIVLIAIALPTISVTVRRLHDRNRSGWWSLLGIVPLLVVNSYGYFAEFILEAGLGQLFYEYGQAPYAIVLILLVLCSLKGDKGANRFGEG